MQQSIIMGSERKTRELEEMTNLSKNLVSKTMKELEVNENLRS
jgi:predicted transcriptional regulator